MRPSHRLDVFAVPMDLDRQPVEALRQFFAELCESGVIDVRGRPGPLFARWMPEGFASVRVDAPKRTVLYANRQGGFRVYCPVEEVPITDAFTQAMTEARHVDRPDLELLACPACGGQHTLSETVGRPTFRFGRGALQIIDAEALHASGGFRRRLEELVGPVDWVGVRT